MSGAEVRLAAQLAQRCSIDWASRFSALQQGQLREIVRTAFVDTLACIFAARNEPATLAIARWAELPDKGGRVRLPVRAKSTLPADSSMPEASLAMAALVNGAAAHALDYDDVGLAGHPSAVLVPALLALHEAEGLRGFALVQAYAKGYAVWADLQGRMTVHLHARGWHPTAVFGTVAAAAAVACARGLPADTVAHAMGIAASSASGLIANFGSMTKAVQVGQAVRAGLEAAELAACGIDSSSDALDGRTGLLAALGGPGNATLDAVVGDDFESTLLRQRPGIKKYPVCYAAHRIIDGVLDLRALHRLKPQDVARVDASLSATTAAVLRHHEPATLAEARFSLEYVVASALVHGAVGLREVSAQNLADPVMRALMRRVSTRITDTQCPLEPSFAYEDQVVLTTFEGSVLDSGPIRFARGHAQLPLTESDLRMKLAGCLDSNEQALAGAALGRIDAALAD